MKTKNTQTWLSLMFDTISDQTRLPLAEIWDRIVEHLRRFDCCPGKFSLSLNPKDSLESLKFHEHTAEAVRDHLAVHTDRGFHITTLRYQRKAIHIWLTVDRNYPSEYGYSPDRKLQPPNLYISGDAGSKLPDSWNSLIEALPKVFPVQFAYQNDCLYQLW